MRLGTADWTCPSRKRLRPLNFHVVYSCSLILQSLLLLCARSSSLEEREEQRGASRASSCSPPAPLAAPHAHESEYSHNSSHAPDDAIRSGASFSNMSADINAKPVDPQHGPCIFHETGTVVGFWTCCARVSYVSIEQRQRRASRVCPQKDKGAFMD